jgi:hypothetical protein
MYHKGYGPTIVTLEKYMRQLFPHLYKAPLEKEDQQTTSRPLKVTDSERKLAEANTVVDPKPPQKK